MRIQWQTADLGTVMRYFAKEFRPIEDNEEIVGVDYYIDVHKNTVVFELTIREKREN